MPRMPQKGAGECKYSSPFWTVHERPLRPRISIKWLRACKPLTKQVVLLPDRSGPKALSRDREVAGPHRTHARILEAWRLFTGWQGGVETLRWLANLMNGIKTLQQRDGYRELDAELESFPTASIENQFIGRMPSGSARVGTLREPTYPRDSKPKPLD